MTLFSMPLAYSSTLDRRPPVAHSATVAVLRGGALEPEPRHVRGEKSKLKHTLIDSVLFRHDTQRVFLSQAGPRFGLALLQAEHHLASHVDLSP